MLYRITTHVIALKTLLLLPVLLHAQTYSLSNPIAGFTSLPGFFAAILNVVIIIATPIVVLFLILAGFRYVMARGNPTMVQEANKSLLYAVIGGVIVVGAVAILSIIQNVVNDF